MRKDMKMLIEKIKPSKEKCTITVEGNEHVIAYEIALRYKLKKGISITLDEYKTILEESDIILCKVYLYKMLDRYLKTEKGYRDKLYQVGYHKKAVENAIKSAKSYGYIDDTKFCENYIYQYKNKKGINRLRQELKLKGVANELLNKIFETYKTSEEAIDNLCNKYMKTKEKDFANKQKLYRHLVSKGFSYEDVSKAVDKCYNNAE
jgi:regulatory protein